MFLVETLLNLVIYVRNMHSKKTEAPFPIYCYISTIVLNDARIHVILRVSQTINIGFSMPCLFVLISHHFKPLTEICKN